MFRSFRDAYYAWRNFHLTQRRLHMISWAIQQELQKEKLALDADILCALNNRRRLIQREISIISKQSQACSECMGKCCSGDHNLFTAVDQVIRKYSTEPLLSYGYLPKENELLSNYNSLKEHLRYFLRFCGLSSYTYSANKRCSHLSERGCDLSVENRPILCLIFTCKKFRDELPDKELIKLANLTMEIQTIEYNILDFFSKRSRFKTNIRCALCI